MPEIDLKSVKIPGGFLIDLPSTLQTREVAPHTIAAWYPSSEAAKLHITVMVLQDKSGQSTPEMGAAVIKGLADSHLVLLNTYGRRAWLTFEEPHPLQKETLNRAWATASGAAVMMIQYGPNPDLAPAFEKLEACIPTAIRSFRPHPAVAARREPHGPVLSEPDEDDLQFLEDRRRLIFSLAQALTSGAPRQDSDADLDTLQRLLDGGLVEKDDLLILEALGIAFGDALARHASLAWKRQSDLYGDALVLANADLTLVAFAPALVLRRITNDEKVNLRQFLAAFLRSVEENYPKPKE